MKERKTRINKNDALFNGITVSVFLLFTFICVYPFYYLLICTISGRKLVDLGRINFFPREINFANYIEIFRIQNLGRASLISTIRTLAGTTLNLFCTSYLAYFFTKQDMWGRKVWYRLIVVTMYFSAGLIPVYLNNRMLGLTNTFWIYIVPGLISVYNMILVKTSIEAMPPDLEESAFLDGAGYLRRYFLIVLPLQKPILATVALFTAVSHWNDFFTTKLYITNTHLYTLQFVLYEMLTQVKAAAEQIVMDDPFAAITPTGIRLTLTAVVVIPVMLVYPFIQRYYVKGIMIGAVKG
jgi:multiple sugar transport system permease protein/putative aldouronate transport system permease protein